ncbi:MAG: LuxR family transcriptional regulator [Paraburkholderia sp.]|nr:MAG: LuxR family transcriptional regulator [Paraburkholderia sp.]
MGSARSEFNESFFERNPSFAATSHVVEFTRPLISLGLGYFTFDRHYLDGSRVALTNHAQWIRFYWESGLFRRAVFENWPLQFSNGHILWNWLSREPIYSAAASHGIDNGVTITKRFQQYCDFFHFGALSNNSISDDIIVKNIEYLRRFVSLFEYKMKPLIRAAARDRIFACVSNGRCGQAAAGKVDIDAFEDGLSDLLGKRDTSRFYLGEEFGHRYLTRGEVILLKELTAGASCSEMSEKLNISNGAIDKHIKNIKEKLGCKTLCHLGFVVGRLDAKVMHSFSDKRGG